MQRVMSERVSGVKMCAKSRYVDIFNLKKKTDLVGKVD